MHKYLTVFLVAMVPVAELRLAVPMAIGMGIDQFLAIAICVAGNIVPVPFIYLFARRFLHWGAKQRYIGKCEENRPVWPVCGPFAVCWHSGARHRCLDGGAGCQLPGHGL